MIADRHAVDDRSERAAEVKDMISSVTLFDNEMVTRQPERHGVAELQVWLQRGWLFPGNRSPANDERPIAESEWSAELTLQPWVFGSEVGIID
jgi:hypothetical protein